MQEEKMTQGTIKIESKITERDLIENCLNYYHSGYDYKILLSFYTFAHHWNFNKLNYYIHLIEDKNEK